MHNVTRACKATRQEEIRNQVPKEKEKLVCDIPAVITGWHSWGAHIQDDGRKQRRLHDCAEVRAVHCGLLFLRWRWSAFPLSPGLEVIWEILHGFECHTIESSSIQLHTRTMLNLPKRVGSPAKFLVVSIVQLSLEPFFERTCSDWGINNRFCCGRSIHSLVEKIRSKEASWSMQNKRNRAKWNVSMCQLRWILKIPYSFRGCLVLLCKRKTFFFNFYAAKFFFMLCSLHCELAQAGACLSLLLQHYVSRNRDLRIY